MTRTKTPMNYQKRARKTKRCLRSLLVSGRHAPVQVSKQRSHPSRSQSTLSLTHNHNASFSRTRLLAFTHPCVQTCLPSWSTSSLSHPYHLPAYVQLYDESNRSIAHLAPDTYVSFSFFIRFFYYLVIFSVILAPYIITATTLDPSGIPPPVGVGR
jgi:hypothetical protein